MTGVNQKYNTKIFKKIKYIFTLSIYFSEKAPLNIIVQYTYFWAFDI